MNSFFLGANSKNGFYSLYGGFPGKPGAFLHILKGGPGTGKSTLLRRIAAAAEQRGLAVRRVLCSGDPDSLDGLFLPELGLAWADGTAPHALEPGLFGVTGDYLDLGRAMTRSFSSAEKEALLSLQEENRRQYKAAYQALADSAAAGWEAITPPSDPGEALEALPRRDRSPEIRRCFLGAVSCKGLLQLPLPEGYQILPASPAALRRAAEAAAARGWDTLRCPWPLDPAEPEWLLLPELKLALRVRRQPSEEAERSLQQAVQALRQAKAFHDEMEAVYRPHMDFAELNEEAERQIRKAFSE